MEKRGKIKTERRRKKEGEGGCGKTLLPLTESWNLINRLKGFGLKIKEMKDMIAGSCFRRLSTHLRRATSHFGNLRE